MALIIDSLVRLGRLKVHAVATVILLADLAVKEIFIGSIEALMTFVAASTTSVVVARNLVSHYHFVTLAAAEIILRPLLGNTARLQ